MDSHGVLLVKFEIRGTEGAPLFAQELEKSTFPIVAIEDEIFAYFDMMIATERNTGGRASRP